MALLKKNTRLTYLKKKERKKTIKCKFKKLKSLN